MKTILLIEDSDSLIQFFFHFLTERGYQVVTARDGINALSKVQEVKPDAVLLDMVLPGLNGWELLDYFAQDPKLAQIPVVVVSGYTKIDLPIPPTKQVVAVFDKAEPMDNLLPVIDQATSKPQP